ncbi:MAG: EAL domain-containing protein [Thermodesulfovibrio sp.]|nr:EAL domain-containing protein [Thermodesulfovibrio sp.]
MHSIEIKETQQIGLKTLFEEIPKRLEKHKGWFALLRIDVFGMGYLNIINGFEKGNKILNEIQNRFLYYFKDVEIVTRAADEFIIFMEIPMKEEIPQLIERIHNLFLQPIENIHVFINGGISIFPIDGKDVCELFEKAGLALKEAKKKGPNVIESYTTLFEKHLSEVFKIENLIREAKQKDLFSFYYLPIFDLKTLKPWGFELLLRIVEKGGKVHPASEFINVLERDPYMKVIEEKIVKEVIEKSQKWNLPVTINISEIGLLTTHFIEVFSSNCKLKRCKIMIEVVERIIIKEFTRIIQVFEKLKEVIGGVAIDDFGTGFSSLGYLKELPFDIIKIDISFIREIPQNQKAKNIVEFIVELGKKLNVIVCAEGVEKVEQLEFLKEIKCDLVQGFLLERPLPASEIEKKYII